MKNIRYYAIGHSYLLHGPFEGWQTDGFWGMAASEPSKDYFHRFHVKLSEAFDCKIESVAENHAEYERCCTVDATKEKYLDFPAYSHMKEVMQTFKPNLISVFIGGGNTIAKDEKSLTLFFEVLYELINQNKREDTVVICIGTNNSLTYSKPLAAKYGFVTADCSVIHEKKGYENPYYAYNEYPEYDELTAQGAVEFRTHPNDKGHDLIAQYMLDVSKDLIEKIPDGDFAESYEYEKYLVMREIPKFEIDVTPKFLVRFNGFNIRQGDGFVSFSSAPGTGASVMGTCIHIPGDCKKFFIEMAVESAEEGKQLVLTLYSKSGEHKYCKDIIPGEMTRYEFDISDIGEMMTVMKVSPDMEECLIKVKSLGFEK